jgi:hypothetical protein
MKELTSYQGLHCANCGAAMQGEFCHECGQSIHSVLKPVHHMVEETVETVLHIDGRIVQTLPPLLLKPGFLTLEYFAGRRVPYIAPFRLMFVLCLLSFFVCHVAVDRLSNPAAGAGDHPQVHVDSSDIDDARTPAKVRAALEESLGGLQSARATGLLGGAVLRQTDNAARELRQKASARLVALGAEPMSAASIAAPLPAQRRARENDAVRKAIEQESRPVRLNWLPDAANDRLTRLGHHFHANMRALMDGDATTSAEAKQRMINGLFGALPMTMFILIPVFAGLLKLFYVFRRRLYMEHLIVALHSHAFMFLVLLLVTLVGLLSTWLHPRAAWTGSPLGWLQTLLILWVPAYLLMMQKRVYHQGWAMTVLKFWFVGWCYFWLLTFALLIAAALGMAH